MGWSVAVVFRIEKLSTKITVEINEQSFIDVQSLYRTKSVNIKNNVLLHTLNYN